LIDVEEPISERGSRQVVEPSEINYFFNHESSFWDVAWHEQPPKDILQYRIRNTDTGEEATSYVVIEKVKDVEVPSGSGSGSGTGDEGTTFNVLANEGTLILANVEEVETDKWQGLIQELTDVKLEGQSGTFTLSENEVTIQRIAENEYQISLSDSGYLYSEDGSGEFNVLRGTIVYESELEPLNEETIQINIYDSKEDINSQITVS